MAVATASARAKAVPSSAEPASRPAVTRKPSSIGSHAACTDSHVSCQSAGRLASQGEKVDEAKLSALMLCPWQVGRIAPLGAALQRRLHGVRQR